MPSKKLSKQQQLKTTRIQSHFEFEAIGTIWAIDVLAHDKQIKVNDLKKAMLNRIAVFDKNYSRFRADSFVSELARTAGSYELPTDAKPLLDLYRRLYDLTAGVMTPLIGQLMSDAGYDAEYSFQTKSLHRPPAWDEVLNYSYPKLVVNQPALLDFGAAGKGYLVDIIAQLLQDGAVDSFTINAGGDILHHSASEERLRVGLEHPTEPRQAIGVAEIGNQSICGSAGNRRVWGNFNHIINPDSLSSPHHLRAVWVVASSTLIADGVATALYFTNASWLSKWYDFEYALVRNDYSLEHSANFPADFFTQSQAAS